MMKRIYLSIAAIFLLLISNPGLSQAPVMTSWVSDMANGTQIQFRMHDRTINQGYTLVEVFFTMSAATCALSDEVRIYIYQNDGSGTYGTQRYGVSFDPGPGTVPITADDRTRILVVSSGSTEPLYARAVISGVLPADDFVLTTSDIVTTMVTSDSYDPNESSGTASAISSGTTHSGLLVNNDADFYPVTIGTGNRHLIVSMSYLNDYITGTSNLDLDLYLSNGTSTLESSISSATSTDNPITESLDVILDPGTYYIVARPKSTDPNRNFYTLIWDTHTTPSYEISGVIRDALVNDISGVTMNGLPGNPLSDVNGDYGVAVDHGWSGTVTPSLTGYTFDPVSRTYTDVQETHLNDDYLATINTYTISGTITISGGGVLEGVTLSGLPGNPLTDASGNYTATVDHGWSGTVTPTLTGYSFAPMSTGYGPVNSDRNVGYTATLNTYTISGTITISGGGVLEGVTLSGLPGNPLSDGSGNYTATVDHGWSGTVTPALTGYTFAPASTIYSSVSSNRDQDYVATINTYTISGTITISGGGALSGVTMTGLPGNPLSDGSGNYTATVDHGWSGTVTPTLTGYTFAPASTIFSSVNSNRVQDYVATINTYTISGTITISGGGALSGVTMNGLPGNPLSDVSGNYTATVDHGWSGTVTPTLSGYTFAPASSSYTSVSSNQSQDYTATTNIYQIDGYVRTAGGTAVEGVVMTGLAGNPSTNAAGYYTGDAEFGTSVTVTPGLLGYSFSPTSATYSPVTGDASTDYTGLRDPYITLSPDLISLSQEAGANDQVTVSSNVDWTVSCPESWVSCTPAAGSDNGSFTITASTANTGASRAATVTVAGEGVTVDIAVIQAEFEPVLEVSTTSVTLGSASGVSESLTITSNIDWVVSESTDWLVVTPTGGSNNGSITITTNLPNETINSRSADVSLSGSGITLTIIVTQEGVDPSLEVSATTVSLGAAAASSQSVDISSNIPWTVSESADWLSVAPVSGTGNGSLVLTADLANDSVRSRSTTVTVSGGAITHNITVTQDSTEYTGINIPLAGMELELYPNPARDHVYLKSDTEVAEAVNLNILSLTGQVLSQTQLPRLIPGEPVKIDLSAYPAGQYLIQIENAYIQRTFKIVKSQ